MDMLTSAQILSRLRCRYGDGSRNRTIRPNNTSGCIEGTEQHFQIPITSPAIPYNCIWHWIRTSQCAGLMSISLQAIIRRWIWWLNPACIHLFSAIAQNHHPPFCNRWKLFVYMCHCRHSKDRETADKWFYWWHLTDELSFSEQYIVFCDADVMLIYCIFGGKVKIVKCLHWWMNGNKVNVLLLGKATFLGVSKYLLSTKMAPVINIFVYNTFLNC